MLRVSTRSRSLIRRTATRLALCGGLLVAHSAIAQERGLLSEATDGSFSAAGQAAENAQRGEPLGPVQGLSTGSAAGQVVQPGQPGQLGQPLPPGQIEHSSEVHLSVPGQVHPGPIGQAGLPHAADAQQGVHLGIQVEAHEDGLKVVNVREDSAAKKAGIKQGDIIKRFKDQDVTDAQSLQQQISQLKAGDEAELVVLRDDEEEKLTAKFEESRYSAARQPMDDAVREELEALRSEVQQLRSELDALKQRQQEGQETDASENAEEAQQAEAQSEAEASESDEAEQADSDSEGSESENSSDDSESDEESDS